MTAQTNNEKADPGQQSGHTEPPSDLRNTDECRAETWIQQANRQVSELIATLEEMETCEASAGNDCGMYATPHLSNIRYVISKMYEVKDAMEVL